MEETLDRANHLTKIWLCVPLKQQWAGLSMPQALLYVSLRVINLDRLGCISHPNPQHLHPSLNWDTCSRGLRSFNTPTPSSFTVPIALRVCRDLRNILRLILMFGSGLGILHEAKHFPSILSKSQTNANSRFITQATFGQLLINKLLDVITKTKWENAQCLFEARHFYIGHMDEFKLFIISGCFLQNLHWRSS